jgi:hypothetical protein
VEETVAPDPGLDPIVVVSADTHIGPRLVEDLRQYCPRSYLGQFDRFAAETAAELEATLATFNGGGFVHHPNLRTLGHYDSAARLVDYDFDGLAAGVIFHGSMYMEPIPFVSPALGAKYEAGGKLVAANEIGAPSPNDLATPIDAVPAGASRSAFRSGQGGGT